MLLHYSASTVSHPIPESQLETSTHRKSRYAFLYSGQIDSVVTLITSADVSPSITDQTAEFLDPIFNATSTSTYQVGFSLVSY